MIKLCRVDNRLLHGQVAFSWCSALGVDAILLASDEAAADPIRMQALRIAKPAGTKLVIKDVEDSIHSINSGATDRYALLIVTDSVKGACRIAMACDRITAINLGGTTRPDNESRSIGPAVHLVPDDVAMLKKLIDRGLEVDARQVATERRHVLASSDL